MVFILIDNLLINTDHIIVFYENGLVFPDNYPTWVPINDFSVKGFFDFFESLPPEFVYFKGSGNIKTRIFNKKYVEGIENYAGDLLLTLHEITTDCGRRYRTRFPYDMAARYLNSGIRPEYSVNHKIFLPINKTHVLLNLVSPSEKTIDALSEEDISNTKLTLTRHNLICDECSESYKYVCLEDTKFCHVWTPIGEDMLIWYPFHKYELTIKCCNFKQSVICSWRTMAYVGDFIVDLVNTKN